MWRLGAGAYAGENTSDSSSIFLDPSAHNGRSPGQSSERRSPGRARTGSGERALQRTNYARERDLAAAALGRAVFARGVARGFGSSTSSSAAASLETAGGG